jgi:hypothetical protein
MDALLFFVKQKSVGNILEPREIIPHNMNVPVTGYFRSWPRHSIGNEMSPVTRLNCAQFSVVALSLMVQIPRSLSTLHQHSVLMWVTIASVNS